MRSFIGLTVLASIFTGFGAEHSLEGVWRLIEVNAVTVADSQPRGQLNRKEYYAPDGKVYLCEPDQPFVSAIPAGTYKVDNGFRVVNTPEGESVRTKINWIDDNNMFLEFQPREGWYYTRITNKEPKNVQWEPRSVMVIQTKDAAKQLALRNVKYDARDYSRLPLSTRITGVWELLENIGGRTGDLPPFGFPNHLYVINQKEIRIVDGSAEDNRAPYQLTGSRLALLGPDKQKEEFAVTFNKWGNMILDQGSTKSRYKLVQRDTAKIPQLPTVIVLYRDHPAR